MRLCTHIARLFVVFAVVVSSQGLLLVQGMFKVNQERIARVLCVNRARPQLHCDGHCFLQKRIQEEQQRRQQQQAEGLEVLLGVTAHVATPPTVPPAPVAPPAAWHAPSARNTGRPDNASVFRPPRPLGEA